MFRRSRKPADPLAHVDPAAVPPRHARHIAEALSARQRWRDMQSSLRDGPTKDRLAGLGAQVDDGVLAVWATVQRLAEIERITAALDVDRVTDELKRVRRDPGADPAMVQALSDRFTSVQRMLNMVDDADRQLKLLEVRLGAAVARAAEVALVSNSDVVTAGDELAGVVTELSALRSALDEVG